MSNKMGKWQENLHCPPSFRHCPSLHHSAKRCNRDVTCLFMPKWQVWSGASISQKRRGQSRQSVGVSSQILPTRKVRWGAHSWTSQPLFHLVWPFVFDHDRLGKIKRIGKIKMKGKMKGKIKGMGNPGTKWNIFCKKGKFLNSYTYCMEFSSK